VDKANKALEQAKANQTDRENAVVKLKETAAKNSPPADIQEQLTAAREARAKARESATNALELVQTKSNELQAAKAKVSQAKSENTAELLSAANATVAKLKAAQAQSRISYLRNR